MNIVNLICDHCKKEFTVEYKKRTQKFCSRKCFGQSKVIKHIKNNCPVCGKKVNYGRVTCSYSCSNTHFRSGSDHPNWKIPEEKGYRSICFEHKEKKCLICGYDRIISVHHLDGDRKNNNIENLIPLCMNHHAEIHSKEWGEETKQKLSGAVA